jgi:hypothetical protein
MEDKLMPTKNSKQPTDKNKIYIGVFSIILILVIILILAIKGCFNSSTDTNSNTTAVATAEAVSVVSEEGDQSETLSANIQLRDVDFSKKIKAIKKYEAKQDGTEGEPTIATSADGYTYLTYSFSSDNAPAFFGTQVLPDDVGAMLVYVFHNKSLIELRVQYGNIGKDGYTNIVSTINSTYGDATYSRAYSNGTEESWWKTDDVVLDVIYQDSGVIAYYRANK